MRRFAALAFPFAVAASARAQPVAKDGDARPERALGALGPSIVAVGRDATRWTLAERMKFYAVPGVSIAVIHGGRVAWASGFGVKEAGTADGVTPATLFQAASISKPVAATAMLRLVEQGKLDLDADVNRYLVSWKVPENEHTASEKVTLRRIVSHNAGLTVHGFPGYKATDALPSVPQLLSGEKPANTAAVRPDVVPGSITRYSGGGTTVMQQLLTDVTGQPFPTLARELVLGPAGMTHSTYEQPLPASRAAEAARAHDARGGAVAGGWHVYPEMAAAGLWTTPTDLARWALAVADARAGRSTALLSREMATRMLSEQRPSGGIGLGPMLGGSGTASWFGHGGANEGFHSDLRYYPELGVGAVVMTNGDRGPLLIREIMFALAAEYGWPDYGPRKVSVVALDTAAIAGMVGTYEIDVGRVLALEVTRRDGKLWLNGPQLPPDQELLPESPTSFVMSQLGWKIAAVRDASGRVNTFTVVRPQGPPIEARRTR